MPRTLGTMLTWTTYGTWLRGDARRWIADGIVFPPDPRLEACDRERLRFPPFSFARNQRHQAGLLVGQAVARLGGSICALTVGRWHLHVVIPYMHVPLPNIVKTVKETVRNGLRYHRRIWTSGYDKRFCFSRRSLAARIKYVQDHNLQDGLQANPWDFIVPPGWIGA